MRKFVLLMMILLLPLRGWAGAVMSVEMSAQELMAAPAILASDKPVGLDIASQAAVPVHNSSDCPDHAVMQAAGDAASESGNHCNTCVACQICHTVALTGILPQRLTPLTTYIPLTSGGTDFASAALVGGFKPPIS